MPRKKVKETEIEFTPEEVEKEKKQEEEKEKESEQKIEELTDGIISEGNEFKIRITRKEPAVWKGRKIRGFIDDIDRPITLKEIRDTYGGGTYLLTTFVNGKTHKATTIEIPGEPKIEISEEEQEKKKNIEDEIEKIYKDDLDAYYRELKRLSMKKRIKELKDELSKESSKDKEKDDDIDFRFHRDYGYSMIEDKIERLEKSIEKLAESRNNQQDMASLLAVMMPLIKDNNLLTLLKEMQLKRELSPQELMSQIMPLITSITQAQISSSAEMDKIRYQTMRDLLMKVMSSSDMDWETMSMPEKADYILSLVQKGKNVFGQFNMESEKKTSTEQKSFPKPKPKRQLQTGKEITPPALPQNPEIPNITDEQIEQVKKYRVKNFCQILLAEIKIGSVPEAAYQAIAGAYYMMPDDVREAIENMTKFEELLPVLEKYDAIDVGKQIFEYAVKNEKALNWINEFVELIKGEEEEEESGEYNQSEQD